MSQSLETEMVGAAVAGDRAAMDWLLRRYSPRMERQLRAYGLGAEERADALQNALVKIVHGLSSFREDARLSTWIFRLTANEALMLLRVTRRSTRRVVTGLELEELASLPGMLDPHETDVALCAARGSARLRRELARLPSSYRAVLVAHYLEELGLDEAGRQLGMTTGAVKATLWRARKTMRTTLDRAEWVPA